MTGDSMLSERDVVVDRRPAVFVSATRQADEGGVELAADSTFVERNVMSERKQRRDKGSFQVSERDVELLGFVGEQYAVTLSQLARLIGRTYRTARGLRDRWCAAGWAESARLTVNLPPFVWLTRSGSRVAESPYRTWDAQNASMAHVAAVTDVRIMLERRLKLGVWECERQLAQRSPSRSETRPHLPDGVLDGPGRVVVEVELTLKSRIRLAAIIGELSDTYQQVWYFAPEHLHTALRRLAGEARWGNVTVHRYPPLMSDIARQHPDLDVFGPRP